MSRVCDSLVFATASQIQICEAVCEARSIANCDARSYATSRPRQHLEHFCDLGAHLQLTTSNSRRGEEERALAMADAGNGEGSGAVESGRGGGDGNVNLNEAIQNMVAQTFSAEQLGKINPSTPEGMASLTAILGQAMQAGLAARTVLDEQTKRATEQKRKKRAEKGADADPKALEKERRKEERDALRKKKQDQKKEEEERKKLPFISLSEARIPSELAYTGARGTVRHIVGTNFARGIEWSSVSKAE